MKKLSSIARKHKIFFLSIIIPGLFLAFLNGHTNIAKADTQCTGSTATCECYTYNGLINVLYSSACSSSESACDSACGKQGNGVVKYRYNANPIYPKNIGSSTTATASPIAATPNSTPTQFTYTLLESLPGFYSANTTMTDLPGLILAIYKFGIWTVGIAGLFMLVVGGIMYMSSAGNTSTASSAQGIITDALIGIVAALGAYLILYVINPDFTKINLNFTSGNVSDYGGPTGTGNPNPESTNCTSDTILAKIKSASQGKLDPCLTFALLNTESGCDASTPNSSANACGIAQMLPGTAGVSCDTLRSNVDLSISTGIQYFLSNSTKIRGSISGTFASNGNSFKQAAEDLYAAYNGGAGALANSVDCAGGTNGFGFPFKAWDCTVNPGGYVQTQAAAPRFLNSYLACNADANLQAKLK